MLVFGGIDSFDDEDWDAVIERYKIDTGTTETGCRYVRTA